MKALAILLLLVYSVNVCAQNLVPNGSFEDTLFCPNQFDQLYDAIGWSAFRYTPDYFNACATTLGVPDNSIGYQDAYTGNGYAGFIAFDKFEENAREYAGIKLVQNLQVGNSYFVSFKVSLADDFTRDCACNKLGALFTTSAFTMTNPLAILNFAHIYSDSIIGDKIDWVNISGTFIADSAYEYLVIGNFFTDQFTDTFNCASESYMFLDNVCVANNEEGCLGVDVSEIDMVHSAHIFPNPFTTSTTITFNSATPPLTIQLFDATGREAPLQYQTAHQTNRTVLTLERGDLQAGVYFLAVTTKDESEVVRLMIE